jgi:hypothetical protein
MKATHKIAFILTIIGGLNWGILGVAAFFGHDLNIVEWIFGSIPWLLNLVYVLVGISAIVLLFGHKKECKTCESTPSAPAAGQQA